MSVIQDGGDISSYEKEEGGATEFNPSTDLSGREKSGQVEVLRDEEVVTRYRLSRGLIFELCGKVDYGLAPVSASRYALPTSLKVLTALRCYATGSIYTTMNDVSSIFRASVCSIVRESDRFSPEVSMEKLNFPRLKRALGPLR